jgi:hypothetical protein
MIAPHQVRAGELRGPLLRGGGRPGAAQAIFTKDRVLSRRRRVSLEMSGSEVTRALTTRSAPSPENQIVVASARQPAMIMAALSTHKDRAEAPRRGHPPWLPSVISLGP